MLEILLLAFSSFNINPSHVHVAEYYAEKNKIPPEVIHGLILVESAYNEDAVNDVAPVHSYGLGQLTIDTAKDRCGLSVENVFNPTDNIRCSIKVLRQQLDRYHWDYKKALSAYNAGTYTTKNADYAIKVMDYVNTILCVKNNPKSWKNCPGVHGFNNKKKNKIMCAKLIKVPPYSGHKVTYKVCNI